MDFLNSNSACWDDDAVFGALESAAFWVKGLPYVESLSGHWKFFLAPSPESVPGNFYDITFNDSDWEALPGKFFNFLCSCHPIEDSMMQTCYHGFFVSSLLAAYVFLACDLL